MEKITQGTIIGGIRSNKYPGTYCYGIIVSARCDLAQNKISKVFYITAISLKDWIFSDVGFNRVLKNKISDLSASLSNELNKNEISWEDIKSFSLEDFNKVIDNTFGTSKQIPKIKANFNCFKRITSLGIPIDEKQKILKENNRSVCDFLTKISNGDNSHYILIPSAGFEKPLPVFEGLIVDLQELDYFSTDLIDDICQNRIDDKNYHLTTEYKQELDKRFFIKSSPGFAHIASCVSSPWIEYTIQHFSNVFIRIGVNNIPKEEIKDFVDLIAENEVKI